MKLPRILNHTLLPILLVSLTITSSQGLKWQSSLIPLTPDFGFDYAPDITRTSDGKLWLAWSSDRQGSFNIFVKSYDGIRWSTDRNLTGPPWNDNRPSMVELSNGTYFLVWDSYRDWGGSLNSEIAYSTSNDRGTTWTSPRRLTNDAFDDQDPEALQTSEGRIWIFWQSKRTGNQEIFYKILQGGSSTGDIPLTNNSVPDFAPTAIEIGTGQILLVWVSNRTGSSDLFYALYRAGWSQEAQLTTDPNSDSFPALTFSKDGILWLVWSSDRAITSPRQTDLFYSKSHDRGATWVGQERLTTELSADFAPSFVQTAPGILTVVWVSNRGGNFDVWDGRMLLRDVALVNLTADKTSFKPGETVVVTLTVQNQAWNSTSPEVRLMANTTLLYTQKLSLLVDETKQTTFTWNTSGMSPGCYTLTGSIVPLSGEDDTSDNSKNVQIRILYPGDINNDGIVNILDMVIVGSSIFSRVGDPKYRSDADINKDGAIDILDLVIVGASFLKKVC